MPALPTHAQQGLTSPQMHTDHPSRVHKQGWKRNGRPKALIMVLLVCTTTGASRVLFLFYRWRN